jgi:DNA polymerase-4
MVARRLREHLLFARTIQLKLRYSDFSTITRAKSLDHATQIDSEILTAIRDLFHENFDRSLKVRLLGVHASGLEHATGQMRLLDQQLSERWTSALSAVDRLRDRYGESAVALARGMSNRIRERVHENPVGLPGRHKPGDK